MGSGHHERGFIVKRTEMSEPCLGSVSVVEDLDVVEQNAAQLGGFGPAHCYARKSLVAEEKLECLGHRRRRGEPLRKRLSEDRPGQFKVGSMLRGELFEAARHGGQANRGAAHGSPALMSATKRRRIGMLLPVFEKRSLTSGTTLY
jgi:hypothetical protein